MFKEILSEYLNQFLNIHELKESSKQLSENYRFAQKGAYARSAHLKKAYLAARMPATFMAIDFVLNEAKKRGCNPQTLLDVGSGPGTATLAALEHFKLEHATLIEQDAEFISIAKHLLTSFHHLLQWQNASFENASLKEHDLTIFSYSLGEISKKDFSSVLSKYWQITKEALIIIEPGTPRGYETILESREILLKLNGHIAAPCPHQSTCSLKKLAKNQQDWCHFSVRVERSFWHRQAKEAVLPYEDEKFSYLIMTKEPKTPCLQRILRHPVKRKGHIHFSVCSEKGFSEKIISKRAEEQYKIAKKQQWGDELPFCE